VDKLAHMPGYEGFYLNWSNSSDSWDLYQGAGFNARLLKGFPKMQDYDYSSAYREARLMIREIIK